MSNLPLEPIAPGPFDPTWESLRTFECPDWFRDAKFGIWAHWGPQCVSMTGDWYARHIYEPSHQQYHHHWRTYGHPSVFGYKDIIPLWRAENFDPDGLMDLYVAAGAKYFVAQAVHHDNFDNWNSRHHRWNAVKMGPRKDIVGLWHEAASRRGLRFGVSEHLGASFAWMKNSKSADPDGPYAGVPYDGADPAYEDLYLPNLGEPDGWYTANPWWHSRWLQRMKDLVDQHQPDLLYSDGGLPFDTVGLRLVAHLYNTSAAIHGANEAVYNQKDANADVYRIGVLDVERGQRSDVAELPWQTDTCVGGWFYDSRRIHKSPSHVIEMLVDIVSKNGCLLLNLPQLPDGTLDDGTTWIAHVLGEWFKANGEGIYGTRPWRIAAEGPAVPVYGAFKEERVPWTVEDFRFTTKGDTVYAFQMKHGDGGTAVIRALGAGSGFKAADVRVLGNGAPTWYEQRERALLVAMPEKGAVPVPCVAVGVAP